MKDILGVSPSSNYYRGVIPHPELDLWETAFLKSFLNKNSSLIDLGCGDGSFLSCAKTFTQKIIGVDLNQKAVQICRQKNIKVFRKNALDTKLLSHSFDIVRAQNILEHLLRPEKLILEAKRLLKPNGTLIIHVPTNFSTFYPITNFWDDYTHIRPFTKKGLHRLLADFNFEIVFLKGYTLGRNTAESMLGKVLEVVVPFSWFVVAKHCRTK